MFNNVIVGIDDDEGGRDAIALAKMLAAGGGKLTLAQVYQGDSAVSRASSPDYEAAQHERIRELLESEARGGRSRRGAPLVWITVGRARPARAGRADRRRPARDRLVSSRVAGEGSDRRRHARGAQRRALRGCDRTGRV